MEGSGDASRRIHAYSMHWHAATMRTIEQRLCASPKAAAVRRQALP